MSTGSDVHFSSLDRVLWPEAGFTKGNMLDYYAHVAGALLPHLRGRPCTLHRFPDGLQGAHFFQTRCPPGAPEWVHTQRMWVFSSGKEVDAPVVDDARTLLWAANLSTVEFHPYLGCADDLARPTAAVFDLDPGPPAGLVDAARVALRVRDLVEDLGLDAYAKTSGAAGVHVYVPANTPVTYDDTKRFARAVAALLHKQTPELVVDKMTRSLRAGKVFVDWSQNDGGKSTIAPYSLRAAPLPTVSTPVQWDELSAAVDANDPAALLFGPGEVIQRLGDSADLFARVLTERQRLPAL